MFVHEYKGGNHQGKEASCLTKNKATDYEFLKAKSKLVKNNGKKSKNNSWKVFGKKLEKFQEKIEIILMRIKYSKQNKL